MGSPAPLSQHFPRIARAVKAAPGGGRGAVEPARSSKTVCAYRGVGKARRYKMQKNCSVGASFHAQAPAREEPGAGNRDGMASKGHAASLSQTRSSCRTECGIPLLSTAETDRQHHGDRVPSGKIVPVPKQQAASPTPVDCWRRSPLPCRGQLFRKSLNERRFLILCLHRLHDGV